MSARIESPTSISANGKRSNFPESNGPLGRLYFASLWALSARSLRSWLYASERSMSPTPRATSRAGRSLGVSADSADSAALAGGLALARDEPSSELPSDESASATLRRGFSGSAAGVGSSLRPLDAG